MESGRVRQIGTPRELYDAPNDAFVADFVGRCNILAGRRESEIQFRTDSGLLLPVDSADEECKDATAFALRPERITLQAGGADGIQGRLKAVTYMGAQTEYVVAVGAEALVVVQSTPRVDEPLAALKPDDMVSLHWDRKAPRLVPQALPRV
jgi:putative spermidine/putrescine transport system ATP-binding protein